MAKKQLTSLIDGIIGGDTNADSEQTKRIGRPKNEDTDTNIRATFMVDKEQLKKLKYISLIDNRRQKDILKDALEHYIRNWESKKGDINIP